MHHADNLYQNLFGTESHLRLRFTTFDVTSGSTTTSGLSKMIKKMPNWGINRSEIISWTSADRSLPKKSIFFRERRCSQENNAKVRLSFSCSSSENFIQKIYHFKKIHLKVTFFDFSDFPGTSGEPSYPFSDRTNYVLSNETSFSHQPLSTPFQIHPFLWKSQFSTKIYDFLRFFFRLK